MKAVKNFFVRNYKIPIQIYEEPYWSHFIRLYDFAYGSERKWSDFYSFILSMCRSGAYYKEFLDYADNLSNEIINSVQGLPEYTSFCEMDMEPLTNTNRYQLNKNDVYKLENDGCIFLSFDMIKANFQMLRSVDPALVRQSESYSEFVSKYTEHEIFKGFKHWRQVIFGNLNPKRQRILQKAYQQYFVDHLLNFVDINDIVCMMHDEVVIKMQSFDDIDYQQILDSSPVPISYRAQQFKLRQIAPYEYYVREDSDGNIIDFKKVPAYLLGQVVRFYKNDTIHDFDKYFYFEGMVARFTTPIGFDYTNFHDQR